jgi:hypothetical protein
MSFLTGHKKIRLYNGAGAARSLVLSVSAKKRRVVKRFFVYRSKVKKLKLGSKTA